MVPMRDNSLLLTVVLTVVALIYLIAVQKLNPFVTLIVVSLVLGAVVGMPMGNIVKAFETGVGNTLSHIALMVGLETMLGKMMTELGGAERIARTPISTFGEKSAHQAMMIVASIIGLPVFFEIGFVLLILIAFNVAKRTGAPILLVGLPMVADLSAMHDLVPPHPAALLAVTACQAGIGETVMYALIVGPPTAILAGPLWTMLVSRHVKPDKNNPLAAQFVGADQKRKLPGFDVTLFTILLPAVLMLVDSWADLIVAPKTLVDDILKLAGNSVMALLIAAIVSFYTLGKAHGFNCEAILKLTNECLAPIATITLVVGAGDDSGQILRDSSMSKAIVAVATDAHLSPLLLGWVVAVLVRTVAGPATVAMTTAYGIVAPIATASGVAVKPELMVLAIGAGSPILSHMNDGGFWLVKEYFNLTVPQTFKTWTVLETIIPIVALLLTPALTTVV